VRIRDIEVRRRSLEEVYMDLTGRSSGTAA
jgi:hypothetical protein